MAKQEEPKKISVDQVIDYLNELLQIDRCAMGALVSNRVPCNEAMADHESVQVLGVNGGHIVGMLGIINGMFGVDGNGYGQIIYESDVNGARTNIVRFRRVTKADKE